MHPTNSLRRASPPLFTAFLRSSVSVGVTSTCENKKNHSEKERAGWRIAGSHSLVTIAIRTEQNPCGRFLADGPCVVGVRLSRKCEYILHNYWMERSWARAPCQPSRQFGSPINKPVNWTALTKRSTKFSSSDPHLAARPSRMHAASLPVRLASAPANNYY